MGHHCALGRLLAFSSALGSPEGNSLLGCRGAPLSLEVQVLGEQQGSPGEARGGGPEMGGSKEGHTWVLLLPCLAMNRVACREQEDGEETVGVRCLLTTGDAPFCLVAAAP